MDKKKISGILFNFIVLVLGVCLILWAQEVTSIVSILLGCVICFYGIINIVNYFMIKDKAFNNTAHFVFGILALVLGLVLIFRVNFLKELISFIVGIYITLVSIIKLYDYIVIRKNNKIKLTSSLVLSLVGLLIGILCIVGKFLIPDVILKVVGYMMVVYSLIDTANMIILGKNR